MVGKGRGGLTHSFYSGAGQLTRFTTVSCRYRSSYPLANDDNQEHVRTCSSVGMVMFYNAHKRIIGLVFLFGTVHLYSAIAYH